MKQKEVMYQIPSMEVCIFEAEDVITLSGSEEGTPSSKDFNDFLGNLGN